MTRQKANRAESNVSNEAMSITQRDGQVISVPLPPTVDYRRPHQDDDGVVPEFVNFSNKVQVIRVPYHDQALIVPPMGLVRGSQWRSLSKPNRRAWGNNPRFMERIQEKQVAGKDEVLYDPDDKDSEWSPDIGCYFDRKYLLTIDQLVNEIKKLTNIKRIKLLVANSVIQKSDNVTMLGYRKVHQGPIEYENTEAVCSRPRLREDRMEVTDAAQQRRDWLEEEAKRKREEQGIFEAEDEDV